MKKRVSVFMVLSLLLIFNVAGCSKLFGPSNEEAVKAIMNTGLFSGGVEKYTLKSPIVVLEKNRNKDGSWTVKVKATFTYTMADGKESKPLERTPLFNIYKSKDSTAKDVWMAKL